MVKWQAKINIEIKGSLEMLYRKGNDRGKLCQIYASAMENHTGALAYIVTSHLFPTS